MSSSLTGPDLDREIARRIAEWQRAGLLTPQQAERIVRAEAARAPVLRPERPVAPPPAGPSVVEALAYVGGALVAAAAAVLVGRLWADLGTPVRVALLAGPAAAGLVAGQLLRPGVDPAPRRLRAVLWAGAAVAAAGAVAVLADAAGWAARDVVLAAAVAGAVLAAGLWSRCPALPLHAATFAGLATAAGAAGDRVTALHDDAAPAAVWLLAVGWVVLGRLWPAVPQRAAAVLGSVVAVLAAIPTGTVTWGNVLALSTAAAVVTLAVLDQSVLLLGVGAIAVFTAVPQATGRLLPGSVGLALGLMIAGLTLIGSAVLTVRRRQVARQRGRNGAASQSL